MKNKNCKIMKQIFLMITIGAILSFPVLADTPIPGHAAHEVTGTTFDDSSNFIFPHVDVEVAKEMHIGGNSHNRLLNVNSDRENGGQIGLSNFDEAQYWTIAKRSDNRTSGQNNLLFSFNDGSNWHEMLALNPEDNILDVGADLNMNNKDFEDVNTIKTDTIQGNGVLEVNSDIDMNGNAINARTENAHCPYFTTEKNVGDLDFIGHHSYHDGKDPNDAPDKRWLYYGEVPPDGIKVDEETDGTDEFLVWEKCEELDNGNIRIHLPVIYDRGEKDILYPTGDMSRETGRRIAESKYLLDKYSASLETECENDNIDSCDFISKEDANNVCKELGLKSTGDVADGTKGSNLYEYEYDSGQWTLKSSSSYIREVECTLP